MPGVLGASTGFILLSPSVWILARSEQGPSARAAPSPSAWCRLWVLAGQQVSTWAAGVLTVHPPRQAPGPPAF